MENYDYYIENGQKVYDMYILVLFPEHHRANKDGYVRLHILQAEKKIGRLLKKDECVHHIDKNKHNNTLDNIIVFRTNADHAAFHKGVRATLCDDGIWECPDKIGHKQVLCPICKVNYISARSDSCVECMNKHKHNLSKIPSREILKDEIYKYSFNEVGRKYGVAGNVVKKWCKKYNLPHLKREINLIPKDEWESESLSENTQRLIVKYYDELNASDEYIVDYYLHCHSITDTARKFHKDDITIKNILLNHNISVLSQSESANYINLCLYKNNEKVEEFHTIKDMALWFIKNNFTSIKVKSLSDRITRHLKNDNLLFGYKIVKE